MEELLASTSNKQLSYSIDQEVEGTIISKTDSELIFDLGTKSDGVLSARELDAAQFDQLKVGDKFKAFVVEFNNGIGQITLSMHKQVKQERSSRGGFGQKNNTHWNKFIQAKGQNSKLTGNVVEINKGGLVVDVDGVRGFLPGSQLNAYIIGSLITKGGDIIGQTVEVNVIEIDQDNNKLIFAQKGHAESSVQNLVQFKQGDKVQGTILAIFPFALIMDLEQKGYGVVFPSDMSWEKTEDPNALFKAGQSVEAQVLGVEPELTRVNLSLKALTKDPFSEMADKFPTDDVISGVVTNVSPVGINLSLKEGIEGFMPSAKQEAGATYEVGQKLSLLVDNVDSRNRRVNVVPMVTSTKDLIYK